VTGDAGRAGEAAQPAPDLPASELPEGVVAPEGLLDAFRAYETALMADDLAALDALFARSSATLRADASGLLVGHDAIRAFRAGRGGAPRRVITELHVRPVDADHALVVALTRTPAGGRGQQTQLWRRDPDAGWVVDAAHVVPPPRSFDASVWRAVGDPLIPAPRPATGAEPGPLVGLTVAVKDLFAVAGWATGAGVAAYLAEGEPETRTAPAVQRLLDAGAAVAGIAQTDQFAYSIAGANPDHGTPPNAAVPGAIPGGSSSGPASAVALGWADIGLGTDTGGSIRVPASYQRLWGLRTSHGVVRREGLLPLAPSFDTIGWLTRDAGTLARAARAGLDAGPPEGREPGPGWLVAPATLEVVDPEVRAAFEALVAPLGAREIEVGSLDELFETFRTVQAIEAWRSDGAWITEHPGALAPDVAGRFTWASTLTRDDEDRARSALATASARIRQALGDGVLLLPSVSTAAPSTTASAEEIDRVRAGTLRLTAIAGSAGLPALSAPLLETSAGPVGLCLVGPRFSDLALIERGRLLAGG